MTPCEEARQDLSNAKDRLEREEETRSGYEDELRDLEGEHRSLERKVNDASGLVVQHERELEQARDAVEPAKEARREAYRKREYWEDQDRRLRNGESTDYDESNKHRYIPHQYELAKDAYRAADDAVTAAEDAVDAADKRRKKSQRYLDDVAKDKGKNETAQTTARNRISLANESVRGAEEWVRNAEKQVNEVC